MRRNEERDYRGAWAPPTHHGGERASPSGSPSGSVRILSAGRIHVFVHWTWLLLLLAEAWLLPLRFSSRTWHFVEWAGIFLFVLLHEYGHALACRRVGGDAKRIMMYPLMGLTYTSVPAGPWPFFWTIAGGPAVNLALVPVTVALALLGGAATTPIGQLEDLPRLAFYLAVINFALLAINMLPIYPLDGGQMVYALVWAASDQRRGLNTAASIGLVLAGLIAIAAAVLHYPVLFLMAGYLAFQAWNAYQQTRR